MSPYVLVKILDSLYYFCRNKEINLSFYDTAKKSTLHMKGTGTMSHDSFVSCVPAEYYTAEVGVGLKRMVVNEYNPLLGDYEVLSSTENFDFRELLENNIEDYTPYKYFDRSSFSGGGAFETNEKYLKYDAALLVQVFRMIGESVFLVLKSRNRYFDAHYVEGKVVVNEINGQSCRLFVTTLFNLNKRYPECEIVDFCPSPVNLKLPRLYSEVEQFAHKAGLIFKKEIF